MNALEVIKFGSNLLKEKKISSFILDSEILLSKTLMQTREDILINLDQKINTKSILVFKEYLQRRSNNEPMAYILGEKEFWSKKFYVNKGILIPCDTKNEMRFWNSLSDNYNQMLNFIK